MDNNTNQLSESEVDLITCELLEVPSHFKKCMYCKTFDDPGNLYISPNGSQIFHRKCRNLKLRKPLVKLESPPENEGESNEREEDDPQKIFRAVGFGEVAIARGIKRIAQKSQSEMVKLNAHALAAKCCRMTQEPIMSHQGVNIIINCGTEPAGGPGAPARPVNVLVQGSDLPSKPLQITK